MNRSYKYEQGGSTDPTPPSWIANDPRFKGVKFIGSDYEKKMNQAQGWGGADFRYDLNGVKFYGWSDDGLEFVDENGNGWVAERSSDGESMFDYLKSLGAKHNDEYYDLVRKLTSEKMDSDEYEQGGVTSKGKPNLVLPRESEGEVRRTEDGREYVMYRNEDTGEMVKVFGSWNEAPRVRERDEQGMGRFMSIDTSFNYPVTQNENGEFILDEAMLDTEQEGDGPTMVYDPEHGRKMPVAPVGNLLKQLEQQREGYSGVDKFSPTVRRGINMSNGGRTYRFE